MKGIYKITCKVTNKIYIGSSNNIEKRWNEHIWELNNNRHSNKHLLKAWHKYGSKEFEFSIIEECEEDDLLIREQYYLDYYKSYNHNLGYNICKDALSPMKGRKHSKETIEHFKQIRKGLPSPTLGKKVSAETKQKLSLLNSGEGNPFYGRKHTTETKNKISKANKGRKVSEEIKEKLRIRMKGENNPVAKSVVKLSKDDIIIKIYKTVTEATKDTPKTCRSSIAKVCNGERKTAGGYKWKYYNQYANTEGNNI